ncbi:MAG: hypothetical protein RBU37_15575 [Myxococcota bacterium]|jgi:hypothetical protein|nr:hypothetical protein [Myxococcota bacterium]
MTASKVLLELCAVIVAVSDEHPRVVTVTGRGLGGELESARSRAPTLEDSAGGSGLRSLSLALPFGAFEPEQDRTLEAGLRRWVRECTALELGYVEQLYTFGDRFRDSRERQGGPRVASVAYLALSGATQSTVSEGQVSSRPSEAMLAVESSAPSSEQIRGGAEHASWLDWYRLFPWEDWRRGRPAVLPGLLEQLDAWVRDGGAAQGARHERVHIAFGLGGAWDEERVLERYELLYEAGLVSEAHRDRGLPWKAEGCGEAMVNDHRRILASALGRLRGKLKYRPVVFELLPRRFTLLQLQRLVEALAGVCLHKQNFRRLVVQGGLVEGTGQVETRTGGRPAELFEFRREVLRERPAPGLSLPALSRP